MNIPTHYNPDGPWLHIGPCTNQKIIKNFKSFRSRLNRKFTGLPITHKNTTIAQIINIKTQNNQLYILPRWTDHGKKILQNKHTKQLTTTWDNHNLLSINLTTTQKPQHLHTQTITTNLNQNNTQTFIQLVNNHIQTTGNTYANAWTHIKNQRPDLYQQL